MKVWFLLAITILYVSTETWAQNSPKVTYLGHRIDLISETYLGLPYLTDPLGENKGYDKDPLYRFDGFDCTTYVETVIAEALATSEEDFKENMNEIRYRNAQVDFVTRNHFTSIDWIHNNRRNGILVDVTKILFKNHYKISETVINKSAWFKMVHKMDYKSRSKVSKLAYLPLAEVTPELLSKIKSGSIINIVRPNWLPKDKDGINKTGTELDISHQGFAIWKDDGILYYRNASSTAKMVTDEPLDKYLKRMKSIKSIGGINVLEVRP